MEPITPVIDIDQTAHERIFCGVGECPHEPAHRPLPVYFGGDGYILTRWQLTEEERMLALRGGDLYIWLQTGGVVLPMLPTFEPPKVTT